MRPGQGLGLGAGPQADSLGLSVLGWSSALRAPGPFLQDGTVIITPITPTSQVLGEAAVGVCPVLSAITYLSS